jgi:hypothetical protein
MKTLAMVLMAAVCIAAAAQGAVYSGTLTGGGGGIYATDGWNSTLTAFTYTVTVPEGPGLVHYKYEWSVPEKGISHLTIEVSSDPAFIFTYDDIIFISPQIGEIAWYSDDPPSQSNPDMPSPMYGVKFESGGGEFNWVIEFDSTRLPTWGDFYSKDGNNPDVYAYNDGFTIVDPPSDPLDPGYVPPSNTPYINKILVPDTRIPEPATVALLGLGMLAGLMRKNIRRNLSLWIVAISVGAMALPASAGVMVLETTSGETSGWTASWDSGLDPYVDITVDSVDSQAVVIQKFAEFNLFKPILITFTQTSASAVSYIVIEDEGITNSSGVDWTDFHFELLDGAGVVKDAVFDPAKTAASGGPGPIGWYIGPFEQAAFADDNTVLNLWDGVVADGSKWYPGDGAQDGQLWIDVNPKLERPFTTFILKEIPTPEPASAALLGLGMLAGLARRRRLN